MKKGGNNNLLQVKSVYIELKREREGGRRAIKVKLKTYKSTLHYNFIYSLSESSELLLLLFELKLNKFLSSNHLVSTVGAMSRPLRIRLDSIFSWSSILSNLVLSKSRSAVDPFSSTNAVMVSDKLSRIRRSSAAPSGLLSDMKSGFSDL